MTAKMENATTLVITPENTAEMVVLKGMAGAKVEVRQPEPFQVNVESLIIKSNGGDK